jgi:hypothetical protein
MTVNKHGATSMTAHPQFPAPRKLQGKNLFLEHDALTYIAKVFDVPPPKRTGKPVLITSAEFAQLLRCSRVSIKMRLQEARRAQAAQSSAAA